MYQKDLVTQDGPEVIKGVNAGTGLRNREGGLTNEFPGGATSSLITMSFQSPFQPHFNKGCLRTATRQGKG